MGRPRWVWILLPCALALLLASGCRSTLSVESVSPGPNSQDILLDAVITLEMSRRITGSLWDGILDIDPAVAGSVHRKDRTLTFVPRAPLRPETTYTVTFSHPDLDSHYSWSFTTGADAHSEEPDQPVDPAPGLEPPGDSIPLDVRREGDILWFGPLVDQYFQTLEWLDDGRRLVARINRDDTVQFALIDAVTGDSQIIYQFVDHQHTYLYLSTALAGELGVVFIVHSEEEGKGGLWHLYLDGEVQMLLPDATYYYMAPDGKRLLAEGPEGIHYLDMVSGTVSFVYDLPQYGFPYSLPGLAWQPGGYAVAGEMWADPAYIYSYDLHQSQLTIAARDRTSHFHSPVWAPDGSALAYLSQPSAERYPAGEHGIPLPASRIYVSDLATGETRTLSLRAEVGDNLGILSAPMWSPDGTMLSLSVGVVENHGWDQRLRNELWGYRWAEGRAGYYRLTDELSGLGLKLPVGFSPDGSHILYAVYPEGSLYQAHDLWMVNIHSGVQSRVGGQSLLGELVWLPDGRLVGTMVTDDSQARALGLADPGGELWATPISGEWIYSVGISPGGEFLSAIIRSRNAELLSLLPTNSSILKEKDDGV